jgi:4-amino-4-deoxy-L-arabinose transferase-like glycosyltransferase
VNWIHIAGYTLCGRNEYGARIGSALLTIGTCLLTWRIGRRLLGGDIGLLGGLVLATCVWTAVGGRAATPDAPLVFCTTLALFLFVRGGGGSVAEGHPSLSLADAAGIGAACGAAVLAKGPVGVVLPLGAFLLWAAWRGWSRPELGCRRAMAGIRPLTMLLAAVLVAAPWCAWVTLRTGGEWPRDFLLVHNVGRFAAPMEGHSGSLLYYPVVLAIGLFPWSIVLAAAVAHAAALVRAPNQRHGQGPLQLLACWLAVWIGSFSCAGTKLPGYIWPAYPAAAIATALWMADWAGNRLPCGFFPRLPRLSGDRVMHLAWSILAAAGLALVIGLPLAAARLAPGSEWLGGLGLIPFLSAAACWRSQATGRRQRAVAVLAAGACLLITALAAVGAEQFSRSRGTRALVARLPEHPRDAAWACLWNVPPSLVFYTGATVERLDTAEQVAAFLARHPRARVVVDSRQEQLVDAVLPPGCAILDRVPTLADHDYLLVGRTPPPAALACDIVAPPHAAFPTTAETRSP